MFAKGDEVLAKHPYSSDFTKAIIMDIKGSNYRVKFPDGEDVVLSSTNLRNKRTSRSNTRSKSGKSPTRTSPSRKKSPGRQKNRSPARSPTRSRKVKSPVVETKMAKISIARIDPEKEYTDEASTTDATESLEGSDLLPLQSRLKELKPVPALRRSTRLQFAVPKTENRATSLPLEKKLPKDDKERGFSLNRDREVDEVLKEQRKTELSVMTKPKEWGGWIGALILTVLLPVLFLGPQVACTNKRCKSSYFRLSKDWKVYFNPNAFYAYAAFIFTVAILSVIPIGRRVDSQQNKIGRLQYRINGLLSAIVILAAYGGTIYKGYKVSNFIVENTLQLAICGFIYGLVLALILYFKARKAPVANQNIYGSSNHFTYDFWQGREVNPRLGPLDFKIVLIRSAVIGSMLINAAILTMMIEKTSPLTMTNLDFMLIASISMQAIYLIDFLVFESMFLTTFEITQEGTGYMLSVGYLMYPFVATLQTRFLLYNKIPLNLYSLILCWIVFFVGYLFYRLSNYQKDAFRKNPFSPAVSHLQSISTSRGKKLIVSGLWGHVRHPNYLGDLILHWAGSLLVLTNDVIPYICAIICTFTLVTRVLRDNARCKSRYNVAWNEYCSRVKYMLIKNVF